MKIAIFTNFTEFNPGYSLSGIVLDQVTMLQKYGNEVTVFVNENYNGEDFPFLSKTLPMGHLVDYRSSKGLKPEHEEFVAKLMDFFSKESRRFDYCFTHDFVFTGWNMPYALALQKAELPINVRWFHWIHSIPSGFLDWWDFNKYTGFHHLVFPNKSDSKLVCDQFRCLPDKLEVIPHIKDLRTWMEFGEDTCRFIDSFPNVMSADIVQILPVSVDRLDAKRLAEVISIFGYLKEFRYQVCLVVANQWATQRGQKESVNRYLEKAEERGLIPMKEVIFTSEWESPKFDVGIPRKMLRELMMLGNLFIFPTREESFGLVVPEASLTGGCLMVQNESSFQQMELTDHRAVYFSFGSNRNPMMLPNNIEDYLKSIAMVCVSRMFKSEAVSVKTFCRQRYNMDYLYLKHYLPALKGSVLWK